MRDPRRQGSSTRVKGLAVAVVVLVAWASLGNTLLGARSPPPPPRHLFAGARGSVSGEVAAGSTQTDYRRMYHDLLAKGAHSLQGSATPTSSAGAGGDSATAVGGSSSGSNDVSQLQAALAAERQRSQQLVQALYAAEQAATKADEAAAAARASSESSRLAPWSEPWSWFGGDENGPQDDNVDTERDSPEPEETSGSLWSTWFGSGDDEEEEGSTEQRGGEGAEKDGADEGESGGWSWLNQVKDGLAAVSPFPAGSLISKTFEPSTALQQEISDAPSPPHNNTTPLVAPEEAPPITEVPTSPAAAEPVTSTPKPAASTGVTQAAETAASKEEVAVSPVLSDPAAEAAKATTQALAKVALDNDEAKKAAAKVFRKSFEAPADTPAAATTDVVAVPKSDAPAINPTEATAAVTGATSAAKESSPQSPTVAKGAASSSAPWPDLSSKGYVTQETLDTLTHGVVGMPHEQPCGSLGACQAMLGQPPVLSAPPGGRKWRVTLMPKTENVGGGVRAYALIGQGIQKHPNVTMVPLAEVSTADLVVWMPGSTKHPPKPALVPARKLVVVDFGDGFQPIGIASDPTQYGLYFKRSWVTRKYPGGGKSRSVGVPAYAKKRGYFPMSYSMAEEFLLDSSTKQVADVVHVARTRPVVCTLRPAGRGNTDVRKQVLGWVREAVDDWSLRGSVVGEVDHGGRREIQNKNYLQTMREARIVVTSNPTGWEGDSRTWEALASGALVMVDTLACPLPYPLLDKVHVVYYDPTDKEGFLKLLKYYLDRPDEARRIGLAGHAHASRHHRTVNRADYLLNVALFHKDKLLKAKPGETTMRRRRLLEVEMQENNGEADSEPSLSSKLSSWSRKIAHLVPSGADAAGANTEGLTTTPPNASSVAPRSGGMSQKNERSRRSSSGSNKRSGAHKRGLRGEIEPSSTTMGSRARTSQK